MLYAQSAFNTMTNFEGVQYGCGQRNVRAAKVKEVQIKGVDHYEYAFASNVCLELCNTCLRSEGSFCSQSICWGWRRSYVKISLFPWNRLNKMSKNGWLKMETRSIRFRRRHRRKRY